MEEGRWSEEAEHLNFLDYADGRRWGGEKCGGWMVNTKLSGAPPPTSLAFRHTPGDGFTDIIQTWS